MTEMINPIPLAHDLEAAQPLTWVIREENGAATQVYLAPDKTEPGKYLQVQERMDRRPSMYVHGIMRHDKAHAPDYARPITWPAFYVAMEMVMRSLKTRGMVAHPGMPDFCGTSVN